MKLIAEFNSIQEIKDFAELIGQKADYIKPEMVKEIKEAAQEVAPEKEPEVREYYNSKGQLEVIETKEESNQVENVQETAQEVAPEKEEAKAEEPTQVKKLTKEDIRAIFSKLIQAGKQKEAKELTNRYGAKKIPEIKEEDYEAIYKEAEELL